MFAGNLEGGLRVLTAESFEQLLAWLDPDREKAGERYGRIHLRLTRIFSCRGCFESERLADEVIDRVASKINWLSENYVGDREPYFYAVARKVYLEDLRKKRIPQMPAPTSDVNEIDEDIEEVYGCLEKCMSNLPSAERELVLQYHQEEKQAKISNRKRLSLELNITLNALRIKVYRIHCQLQQCVRMCVEQVPAH
jgi:DNA-directed RNA polymerase specialized sigma24 family protein